MAKSSRSKIKLKHAKVRRENIHKPIEDARLARLAARQAVAKTDLPTPFDQGEMGEGTEESEVKPVIEKKVYTLTEKIVKKDEKARKFYEKLRSKKASKEGAMAEEMEDIEVDEATFKKALNAMKKSKKSGKKATAKGKLRW